MLVTDRRCRTGREPQFLQHVDPVSKEIPLRFRKLDAGLKEPVNRERRPQSPRARP